MDKDKDDGVKGLFDWVERVWVAKIDDTHVMYLCCVMYRNTIQDIYSREKFGM